MLQAGGELGTGPKGLTERRPAMGGAGRSEELGDELAQDGVGRGNRGEEEEKEIGRERKRGGQRR